MNLIESAACCGGDVVVFRPQFEVNARFLGYATDCRPAAVQKARMGRGITVKHIYDSELRNLVVALPPLDEQAAIVRFLDHADRRIRQYIRAKKKLIALLNEQKQAIVDEVVTRGLDRHAPLKPSGMRWIPQVPAHWSTMPAKALYSEVNERSESGAEELLSVSHITGVTPRRVKNVTMFLPESFVGYKICRPGDLVINTMWAWMAGMSR